MCNVMRILSRNKKYFFLIYFTSSPGIQFSKEFYTCSDREDFSIMFVTFTFFYELI